MRNWDQWVIRVRIKYRLGYGRSRCGICGKLLVAENWDLHEALFTRGDLRGVKWQREIFHPFNSVGVCHHACHIKATSGPGKLKLAKVLIDEYGFTGIAEWVYSLPFKSQAKVREILQLLKEADHG